MKRDFGVMCTIVIGSLAVAAAQDQESAVPLMQGRGGHGGQT